MHKWSSLSHVRWDCIYHIIIIPKYRKKVLYGKVRTKVGEFLRTLCDQKGIEVLEGHCMPDHVHMCLRIPPKFSVAYTVGFLKGKCAVRIHRQVLQHKRMTGLNFWAPGYSVSTVGYNEEAVRKYIREQEKRQQDQQGFDFD